MFDVYMLDTLVQRPPHKEGDPGRPVESFVRYWATRERRKRVRAYGNLLAIYPYTTRIWLIRVSSPLDTNSDVPDNRICLNNRSPEGQDPLTCLEQEAPNDGLLASKCGFVMLARVGLYRCSGSGSGRICQSGTWCV